MAERIIILSSDNLRVFQRSLLPHQALTIIHVFLNNHIYNLKYKLYIIYIKLKYL